MKMKLSFLFLFLLSFASIAADISRDTLQSWVVGEQVEFDKSKVILWIVPWNYTLKEKIDLARASQFAIRKQYEDSLIATIDVPIFGRFKYGKDTGLVVGEFNYVDSEGAEQRVLILCEYLISGIVVKDRTLIRAYALQSK